MGGLNPVEGWLRKAIASGKSVVTANKQLIAYRGAASQSWPRSITSTSSTEQPSPAECRSSPACCRASAATRSPASAASSTAPATTSSAAWRAGADYATVLADAQQLGYAEADPSADVDGYDARAKLCILSRIAMHAELDPDAVATQTISTVEAIDFSYAKELGCTIRQVSRAPSRAAQSSTPA